MSDHVDESVDQDLLLAFSTEPGGKPPESAESLGARVECLERALHRSSSQIESLKSEVATLVGTIDDITKQVRSPRAPVARPRRGLGVRPPPFAAIAGILLGVLLGVFGWTIWSRDSTDTIGSAPEPVAEQQPSATKSPSPPVITLAAATPVPAEEEPAPARFAYVGTLSIDAAPGGQVFINRQARGQTPLRVQNLKAGSHLVWIEREGYRRFTRVVEVPADRVSRVFADLEPIPER